jgi:hypothetical protein
MKFFKRLDLAGETRFPGKVLHDQGCRAETILQWSIVSV